MNGSGSGGSPGSGSSSIGSNTSPRGSAFLFPPPQNLGGGGHAGNGYGASAGSDGGGAEHDDEDEEDEEREEARRAALEFMVSLSESKPGMVRKVDGWVAIIVRACLEGMGEILDTQEEMNRWLDADVRPLISSTSEYLLVTCIFSHTAFYSTFLAIFTAIRRSDGTNLPASLRTST